MRGALYTLGLIILQVLLTFCISMFVVLQTEHEWAKRALLIAMLIMQLLMAAWALLADPADRLEGIISCLVSLVEASATGILLAAAYLQDTAHKSSLETMGLVSTGLLIVTVFAPIGLSMYDSILLPTAIAYQVRKSSGQSALRAVFGIVLQLIISPIVIIANLFGFANFNLDMLEATVGEMNTTVSDGALSRCSASTASDQARNSEDEGKPAGSLAPLTDKGIALEGGGGGAEGGEQDPTSTATKAAPRLMRSGHSMNGAGGASGTGGSGSSGSGGRGSSGVARGRASPARREKEHCRTKERGTAGDGPAAYEPAPFPQLARIRTGSALSLETAPAGQPPTDPFDLSKLSAQQLHRLLCKLVGGHNVPPLTAPTGAASAAMQLQSLADQVRAGMASAPLALLDEVGSMLGEVGAGEQGAFDGAVGGVRGDGADGRPSRKSSSAHPRSVSKYRLGSRGERSPSAKEHGRSEWKAHNHHHHHHHRRHSSSSGGGGGSGNSGGGGGGGGGSGGAGSQRRHGSRPSKEAVGATEEDGSAAVAGAMAHDREQGDDADRRCHRRHHRHSRKPGAEGRESSTLSGSRGISRHQQAQERALESRIADALNPDREDVEAERAARRLERRIARIARARALRSEGYGSPLKELHARRESRGEENIAAAPGAAPPPGTPGMP